MIARDSRVILLTEFCQAQIQNDCCVSKFLRRSMEGKHLMRFQSETVPFSLCILLPKGRAPFGQHQESQPLARSNDIPVLNGFVKTIDLDQNQSDLSDLTLSMRRVTGSP